MKELNINGQVFAKYEIEGDALFLKMIIPIVKDNARESEDILIFIIQQIESVELKSISYLNVE